MKIQKEIILDKRAVAAIVAEHLQRQSPGYSITVRFAGFECNRKTMPKDLDAVTRFVLVVDESEKLSDDEYAPYAADASISLPAPVVESFVAVDKPANAAKTTKNTNGKAVSDG